MRVSYIVMFLGPAAMSLRMLETAQANSVGAHANKLAVGIDFHCGSLVGCPTLEIKVDGTLHLMRKTSTSAGDPVMLRHLKKGSVVTAHAPTSGGGYAYLVGTEQTQITSLDGWALTFKASEETGEEEGLGVATYEALVEVAGAGQPLTIEVNNEDRQRIASRGGEEEVFAFPAEDKNTLIKVVSESGDTCTYRVGSPHKRCELDNHSWGVVFDSLAENDKDETDDDTHSVAEYKKHKIILTMARAGTVGPMLVIAVDGAMRAKKTRTTDEGKPVTLHHILTGSVVTAVSPLTGEARAFFVGNGAHTLTINGWTLSYKEIEETEGFYTHEEQLFDVKATVHGSSLDPWAITNQDREELLTSKSAALFPELLPGFKKGEAVIVMVLGTQGTQFEICRHIVGSEKEVCPTTSGWTATLESVLEVNDEFAEHHYDTDDEDNDAGERSAVTFNFHVVATNTGDESTYLECTAQNDLEMVVTFVAEKNQNIFGDGKRYLTETNESPYTKTTSFTGTINHFNPFEAGFECVVWNENHEQLCKADSSGGSWTMKKGCTLEIEEN